MVRKQCGLLGMMLLLVIMAACSEKKGVEVTVAVPLTVFQQEITAPSPPQKMKAGEKSAMEVIVKNTGSEAWQNKGSDDKGTNMVALGFLWYNSAGEKVNQEQGVSLLPNVLKPGESVPFKVTVQAPSQPGDYTLYFSMFQHNVAWFNHKGAAPLAVNVKVEQ